MRRTEPMRGENTSLPGRIVEHVDMIDAGSVFGEWFWLGIPFVESANGNQPRKPITSCLSGKAGPDMTSQTYKDCVNHATAGKRQQRTGDGEQNRGRRGY